jgi:hypothetical protein
MVEFVGRNPKQVEKAVRRQNNAGYQKGIACGVSGFHGVCFYEN